MPEETDQREAQRRKQLEKRLRAMQVEQQKRGAMKKLLTPEAYERLSNVRVSNHELYAQVVDVLLPTLLVFMIFTCA